MAIFEKNEKKSFWKKGKFANLLLFFLVLNIRVTKNTKYFFVVMFYWSFKILYIGQIKNDPEY